MERTSEDRVVWDQIEAWKEMHNWANTVEALGKAYAADKAQEVRACAQALIDMLDMAPFADLDTESNRRFLERLRASGA